MSSLNTIECYTNELCNLLICPFTAYMIFRGLNVCVEAKERQALTRCSRDGGRDGDVNTLPGAICLL